MSHKLKKRRALRGYPWITFVSPSWLLYPGYGTLCRPPNMEFPMRRACCTTLLAILMPTLALAEPIEDTAFQQETHEGFPMPDIPGAEDVRAVAVWDEGTIWAATKAGVFSLSGNEWTQHMAGPAFDVAVIKPYVHLALWNGGHEFMGTDLGGGVLKFVPRANLNVAGPIGAIAEEDTGGKGPEAVFIGPGGIFRGQAHYQREALTSARSIRAAVSDGKGGLWIATAAGLFHQSGETTRAYRQPKEILSSAVQDLAFAPDGRLWAGGLGGVTIYEDGEPVERLTPKEGLPTIYVQAVATGPDGRMWVGTTLGVVRFDGKSTSLRHSRRWLLDDNVRDIAFGPDGTAWIATAKGVSAIRSKGMTLTEKADYFDKVAHERHVRAPWLVEKIRLETPGDLSKWKPEDDDNDGEYTAMYLAAQSFRYAATKDPKAREYAKKAFAALQFLQTVTESDGFFARTVVPADWTELHDTNRTYTPEERAEELINDPRFRPVEQRWRPSADGKWLWKGDTSSDEITGHFYGYAMYYDLAADDAERARVRAHTKNIMDHLIRHDYVLMDTDGAHTRWGVWTPERLNNDPDWAAERNINSAELLSFLKVTYHMTGEEKYQEEYLRLIRDHNFLENARHAKVFAPAWRTHIDDELLAFVYPGLMLYEQDPEILKVYRESLDEWYGGIAHDQNPLFNFVYAQCSGENPNMDESLLYLRDTPLDLIFWTVDNAQREDLRLVRAPNIEPLQTGRLVPPSERVTVRWDKNPWMAVSGDGGQTEWAPTSWLIGYWMGVHLGYLSAG